MNAALIGKAGKSALAAAGMSLLAASGAVADNAPVAPGAQATLALSSYYANPPIGTTTLNGVPFTTGSSVQLGNGASASYALSYQNPSKVYLLLNTSNTSMVLYDGSQVGTVTLTFANGASQSVNLVAGSNIREWAFGTDWTVDSLTDSSASNWWTGTRADDPSIAAGLDMLTVTVSSANSTSSLTGVSLTNTNDWGNLNVLLAGLTIAYNPPAPKTTVSRPGNSCNTPALQNSQAPANANSVIFNPTKLSSAKPGTAGANGAANSLRPCN
jgi:hypothetical protein